MTKKEAPDPFHEALRQYASAQMRAANARFRPVDPTLEKPRDVTAKFVEDVAAALNDSIGPTKLVSSRREVQIQRGDLSFRYPFQSSMNNTAGATIVLWPHAAIHSHTLRLWRRDNPYPRGFGRRHSLSRRDDGCFVAALLGNFFSPHRVITLEIVDPADRPRSLKQIVDDCSTIDARLRQDLKDRQAFFAYATRPAAEIECFGDNACEYIAANWGIEAVKQYARDVMASQTDARLRLHQHFSEVSANPDTRARTDFRTDGIARFFLAHGLAMV